MFVYTIRPLADPRWEYLVNRHPRACVFHSSNWLATLQQTYGYEPLAITSTPPEEPLQNALIVCKVESRLTGRRLVSLPFSDHCDVLVDSESEQNELFSYLFELVNKDSYRHLELRPSLMLDSVSQTMRQSKKFCLHRLRIDLPAEILFRNFHKGCIQRKIQRAEREILEYESGRCESLVSRFYELLLRTRRRHGLPPQPVVWFRNMIQTMGSNVTIRLVSKSGKPVAAVLTLLHKHTVTYKYGCSDERFHQLGGMPYLFWKTIEESRQAGYRELDLGRSEPRHTGLIAFKDHLGAEKQILTYWRYPSVESTYGSRQRWFGELAKRLIPCLPDRVFAVTGRLLYRHIG